MSSADTTTTTMTTMPSDSSSTHNGIAATTTHATNNSTAQQQQRQRVILLLDLDCFYAQCECVRLGMDAHTTPLALLQWNSVLAVTYPARERFHIKRGDSWDEVREKSNGQCYAVSVPILTTGNANTKEDVTTEGSDMSGEDPVNNSTKDSSSNGTSTKPAAPHSLEHDYDRIFLTTPEQQAAARRSDLGRRRFSTEGKACIERYRVASARIFETVHEWIAETAEHLGLEKKDHIVLERASIDEFFLDVSAACSCDGSNISTSNGDNGSTSATTTATVNAFWNNLVESALANTVRIGGGESPSSSSGESKTFLEPSAWTATNDPDLKALYRGCAIAYGIRQAVFDRIGFTLSAGVSVNKTLAKLSAAYGKPQGQALTEPSAINFLLQDTQIGKCRNLGGKLGKKVSALLPTGVPTTVGSIARYLSLPDLRQGLPNPGTALWVYQIARGLDSEGVAPKTETALTKSITAFKSLPFSAAGHSLNNASTLQWIQLLAQEVVTRVEQDTVRHGRYPRTCTIQYALAVHGGGAGSRNNTSIRTHFPAQRLSVSQRIADLVGRIPALIQTKEGGGGGSSSDNKAVPTATLHRVGLCAIDFVVRQSNNAIDNYFTSASSASPLAAKGEGGVVASPASERKRVKAALSTAATEVAPAVDPDLELARKLQASYDREDRVLQVVERKGGAVTRRPPKTRKISTFFTKR
jgi:DNA polymerase eta